MKKKPGKAIELPADDEAATPTPADIERARELVSSASPLLAEILDSPSTDGSE